jgi:tetratricopeptide (TPR) repeat protein
MELEGLSKGHKSLTTEQALDLAMQYQMDGDLSAAGSIYQQILQLEPDQPVALHLLGVIAGQVGKIDIAIDLITKALTNKADSAQIHNDLGKVYREAGRLEEAAKSLRKAVSLDPNSVDALRNLGDILIKNGEIEDAIEVLQDVLNKAPELLELGNILIKFLRYFQPMASKTGAYVEAHNELQKLASEIQITTPISDEAVRKLFRDCRGVLERHGLDDFEYPESQIWRGKQAPFHHKCESFMALFETHEIIPETCFGCYKVQAAPRTVVELFKVMLVFDALNLSQDHNRKCMVELRPEISGAYKGLIYCYDLEDAQEILGQVRSAVETHVSKNIPVVIKRGCSEYAAAIPEFNSFKEDGSPVMTYNEDWRRYEESFDREPTDKVIKHTRGKLKLPGLTLHDALIMRTWVAYATAIGDPGGLWISGAPVLHMVMEERPTFQPTDDA